VINAKLLDLEAGKAHDPVSASRFSGGFAADRLSAFLKG
jgi:hypothetical protein